MRIKNLYMSGSGYTEKFIYHFLNDKIIILYIFE